MPHTPGPWRVVHTADDRTFIDTEESNDSFIAQVDRNAPEYEDNAQLIAAAPELLEALKRIIEWDDTGCDPSRAVLRAARAIIAKAEGKG